MANPTQDELCLICSDRASGFHYGQLSCEGCKGFFRRSITKGTVYECKYGGNCEIDMYMRRKCQACRLNKCKAVGMRQECVVPEVQCAIKRQSKRAQKEHRDKPNSTTAAPVAPTAVAPNVPPVASTVVPPVTAPTAATTLAGQMPPGQTQLSMDPNYHHPLQIPHHMPPEQPQLPHYPHHQTNALNQTHTLNQLQTHNQLPTHNQIKVYCDSTPTTAGSSNNYVNDNLLTIDQCLQMRAKQILEERLHVIHDLIRYQDEFESPKEEDIRNVAPYNERQGENQLKHFTEMTILTVKLIVEFAKKVHGFETLTREDQITLLKASASEVMMLRSTRKYDIKTDSILFANNQPFTRENYRKAHIGEIADAMFNFCRSTVILRLDPAEYALITALIIFSERPNLREPQKIEIIQDYYLELMQAYVESREQSEKCKFARLLSLLPELRALGIVNSDVCLSLRVKNQRLPEFLAEIWDVNQEKPED